MMSAWSWLDRHPQAYLGTALLPVIALVWHALRAPSGPEAPSWRTRWAFPLLVLLALAALRWPQLIAHEELNPDESQFIAGALTLRHDPVFWRSVDGMTAGPLASFALLPVLWLGLPLNYLAARVVALLALWLTFTFGYRLVLAHYHRRAASLGSLPAVLFFAAVGDPDFNHFSSEMVPLVLLSGATLVLGRPGALTRPALFWGGMLAGLTPWAKLQSAPIGAVIVALALVRVAREHMAGDRLQRLALLAGSTLVPAAGVLGVVWAAGLGEDFYRSYLIQNLIYAKPATLRALTGTSRYLHPDFATIGYLTVLTGAVLAATVAWIGCRRNRSPDAWRLLSAAGLLLAAIACVLAPGRDFLHYTLLLLPPTLLLQGGAIGAIRARTGSAATWSMPELSAVAATVIVFVLHAMRPLPPLWGRLATNARFPISELGALVRTITVHEPTLSVWGWQHQAYVETGARQGTRSAYTYWEIVQHPQREYFRRRYLADFATQRPAVFLDMVGESTFYFSNRAVNGHESFPELARLVARDYCQVAELRYSRVYVRRDVLTRYGIAQRELWHAYLSGAPSDYLDGPENQDLNRFTLPKTTVEGRFVMMMRPPARVGWTLSGTERELRLLYGYIPEAALHAEGNGTELIVSLVSPDGSMRQLTRFLFDPAHERGRGAGPRSLRVLLPPGEVRGSTLQLETTPGPGNEEAWDWLYVTRVGLLHYGGFLPRQFPAFNRPPDAIEAPLGLVSGSARDPELLLHAPATLRFRLAGHERTLDFTFGFRRGAFTNGGLTNGAIFRVRVKRPGVAPAEVLYERLLDPVRQTADRSTQHATLDLPTLPADTELELVIDPNGSNAWDWTFVDSLRLG